jgi:hypothetical protein
LGKIECLFERFNAAEEQNVSITHAASETTFEKLFGRCRAVPLGDLVAIAAIPARMLSDHDAVLQGAFLALSLVLVVRLTGAKGAIKSLLLALFSLLYPTMLFLLNVEQYIFSVFWLILLVWMLAEGGERGKDTAWVAAAGSTLTSGIFLLLLPERGTVKEKIKQGALAVLQFARHDSARARGDGLSSAKAFDFYEFAGEKLPFVARAMQYSAFVFFLLIAPET